MDARRRDAVARVLAAVGLVVLWLCWPELGAVVAGSVPAAAVVRR